MTRSAFFLRMRFLAMLFLIIIAVNACADGKQEDTESTSEQSLHLDLPSARMFWAQALATAQKWRPDAYVSVVRVRPPLPDLPNQRTVRFSFQSPSEDYVTFVVVCSAKGCHSFEVEQKPQYPLTHCTPIALDDFTLDSGDAFEIGLQYGGKDYTQLQDVSSLLSLSRASPDCNGPVQWRASFTDLTPLAFEGLDIIVDAVTGEVVEIRD